MYSALDVARYIILREGANNRPVSNLRLQKLLYFVQAQFLATTNKPCFADRMEAWDFGPVVPIVYHAYKVFGSSNIPCPKTLSELDIIGPANRGIINAMLDHCAQYSTATLVEITHSQRPWIDAYACSYDKEITQEAITAFFKD